MIEFIDMCNGNVIGLKVDGKISKRDISDIAAVVEEKLKKYEKLRVYVEVLNMEGISAEALWDDLKLAFKHYVNFSRKAVVTDRKWVRRLTPIVSGLLPGIEVRCFSFDEKNRALEWIKE